MRTFSIGASVSAVAMSALNGWVKVQVDYQWIAMNGLPVKVTTRYWEDAGRPKESVVVPLWKKVMLKYLEDHP